MNNYMDETKQRYGTALIKAVSILDFLLSCEEPQALHIIAKNTGLTNSTALKILETLLSVGYVNRDADLKKFELGSGIIRYAQKAVYNLEIKRIAQPYLEELQRITAETVHLGIHSQGFIYYVTKIDTKKAICHQSIIGRQLPMYCSAMGKAILAAMPDDEIEAYLNETPLIRFTDNTFTNRSDFLKEIEKIRRVGYSIDNAEHEEDVCCIGASITNNGETFGAISVSIPLYRLSEELKSKVINGIIECKQKIVANQ